MRFLQQGIARLFCSQTGLCRDQRLGDKLIPRVLLERVDSESLIYFGLLPTIDVELLVGSSMKIKLYVSEKVLVEV